MTNTPTFFATSVADAEGKENGFGLSSLSVEELLLSMSNNNSHTNCPSLNTTTQPKLAEKQILQRPPTFKTNHDADHDDNVILQNLTAVVNIINSNSYQTMAGVQVRAPPDYASILQQLEQYTVAMLRRDYIVDYRTGRVLFSLRNVFYNTPHPRAYWKHLITKQVYEAAVLMCTGQQAGVSIHPQARSRHLHLQWQMQNPTATCTVCWKWATLMLIPNIMFAADGTPCFDNQQG